ncbi:uncharacterized protein LOC142046673 [Chelonoidis abingdonii]|uniref:uncharacterized protein LOC142046673 n=1 Tax=Chelonoidis abingdonii TaxID=106734 RepID=UPI003F49A60A
MPPRPKRAPAWSTAELQDLISVWGEEAVQAQLRSSRRNYDTYGQISKSMQYRGYDRDAVQCRVKVKELRSAYCKAREGNHRSGATPTTCRFYKELDAILGCNPTANPRITMDSSEPGEEGEGVEEPEREATEVFGDSQESCSQELFSSQEEASQSQPLGLGSEEPAEEPVPVTLDTAPSAQTSEKLRNLRKKPRKSKEELVKAVMNLYSTDNKKLQDWRENESRRKEQATKRKEKAAKRKELATKRSTNRLLSILERHTDLMQSMLAMQAEHYRAFLPPSQSSTHCAPLFPQNTLLQHPGSYHHQLPPTPIRSPNSPENYDPYPMHSTPITMQHINPEVQQALHSTQGRTYSNL